MRTKSRLLHSLLIALLAFSAMIPPAHADRIKDVASVAAARSNQLIGYGLVVGLQGTGDGLDVAFTLQSLRNMMRRMGVTVDGALNDFETNATAGRLDVKNIASVMVTAEMPGFAKPGQKIDVNVSAIGKASSLRGGSLLLTSLRGVNGEVYAIAQGALLSFGASGEAAGSKVSIGVPTAARIPGGATVERLVETPFDSAEQIVINARESDFTTTTAIVNAINKQFGDGTARALDGMSLTVRAPEDVSKRVAFVSMIENLDIQPGEPPARVVVNSRTGTVVISRNVKVSAAAVSHGAITVAVAVTNEVSQPAPLAQGQTTPVQNAEIKIEEPNKPMFLFQPGVDLRQIVDAVNQVGASPSSLIAILEALKSSGSLRADLIVI
ncbi:MAG: flagellar basal body P-ring protein FlgI [Quisquiliibacterium sp.]